MGDILLGALAIAGVWVLSGLLILCYSPIFIQREAPLGARLKVVFDAAWRFPAYFILHQGRPAIVLAQSDMPADERVRFERWKRQFCQCDECQAERGE